MTSNSMYETNRNLRSLARDSLISFVNTISISDMDSLRTQAGMLSILTSQTDEITRNSEVQFKTKNFRRIWLNKKIDLLFNIDERMP